MKFHGRKDETEMLQGAVSRPTCFVVLTGRRRIGKTRLVREALKGIEHVELFIPRKRLTLALENMAESISEQTGYSPPFRSFREVFEYLFRVEKKPVFIDEISNLYHIDPGALSDLQEIIDKHGDEWGIRLVVDGSYVGVMKKIFEGRKEPLFGRATEMMELGPLPVRDAVAMAMDAGFDFRDSLEAYAILGGVPRYLELLEQYENMLALSERMFSPGSVFLPEGENILITEFGASWETYFSILEVMARGKLGPSAMAATLGMQVQMLPKYLGNLEGLHLASGEKPLLGKERHVRYAIRDPFFQLWFGVCHPRIERYRDGSAAVPAQIMASAVGWGMERVVREMLSGPGALPFTPDAVGGWWDRSGHELDVLAFSKRDRAIVAGEVKWKKRATGIEVIDRLLENVRLVDWHNKDRKEYLFVVSKAGFTARARKLMEARDVLGLGPAEMEGMVMNGRVPEWQVPGP